MGGVTTPENGPTPVPVEELIGWRRIRNHEAQNEYHDHWLTPDGREVDVIHGATVDDLAGWLRERCRSVEVAWEEDDDEPEVFWIAYVVFDAPTIRSAEFNAPTILDALEAAVRAVHEQETTDV